MTSHDNFTIRTMSRQELDIAVEWAAREGWNPGLYDADTFFAADPKGFLIGYIGDEPVATLSAVRYGRSFGFLGMYIVKPEFRGHGYGRRLWDVATSRLKDRTIGLDGVIERQDNYARHGFKPAFRSIRFCYTRGEDLPEPDDAIVPLQTIPFQTLKRFDRHYFPEARTNFLEKWINQPEAIGFAILKKEKLSGYGLMRKCRDGYKVGPLFAENASQAEKLLNAFQIHLPKGSNLYLDVPSVNPAAIHLAHNQGMAAVFETARMYLGDAPTLPFDKIFGITSFELG